MDASASAGAESPLGRGAGCGSPLLAGIGRQVKWADGFAGALDVDEVNRLEQADVLERRRLLAGAAEPANQLLDASGLALSGGGIRSATFALGIVEVLQRQGLLRQFDYLSTVSGGGYLGSFLSCYLGTGGPVAGEAADDPPAVRIEKRFQEAFQADRGPESTALRHLRNNSRYLLNGGVWAKLAIFGQVLAGVLFNLMLVLPIALAAALLVKGVQMTGYFGESVWLVERPEALVTGLSRLDTPLGRMLGAVAMMPGTVVPLEFRQPTWFPGWDTPALQVLLGLLGVLTLMTLFMPVVQNAGHGRPPATPRSTRRLAWDFATLLVLLLTLAAALLWALPAGFRLYGLSRDELELVVPWEQFEGRLDAVLAVAGLSLSSLAGWLAVQFQRRGWYQKLIRLGFLLTGPLLLLLVFFMVGWRLMTLNPQAAWPWPPVLGFTCAITLWGWLGVNVNTYSPHGYYRNRLCECYLACRHRNEADWFKRTLKRGLLRLWRGDDGLPEPVQVGVFGTLQMLPLSRLGAGAVAPYHLVNAAVNLPSSAARGLRGRKCDFFLLSRRACGSPISGYVRTEALEALDPHLDLGTAMAVSGAAASSNMGWKTDHCLRMLMTLTNIRLGYWLRHPARGRLPSWLRGAGPWYLFKEMFGLMSERARYLNLSDGGHIENLAVYELLRRRLKFIVCVDGGQGGSADGSDLVRLQRYARIDLGVRLEFDLEDLQPGSDGFCRRHAVLVRVVYPGLADPPAGGPDFRSEEAGWMLYIKLAMTGAEPPYVREYRREHPDFPHQTTGDQLFDEAQFDSYRALGACAMEGLCDSGSTPTSLSRWFEGLTARLAPPSAPRP